MSNEETPLSVRAAALLVIAIWKTPPTNGDMLNRAIAALHTALEREQQLEQRGAMSIEELAAAMPGARVRLGNAPADEQRIDLSFVEPQPEPDNWTIFGNTLRFGPAPDAIVIAPGDSPGLYGVRDAHRRALAAERTRAALKVLELAGEHTDQTSDAVRELRMAARIVAGGKREAEPDVDPARQPWAPAFGIICVGCGSTAIEMLQGQTMSGEPIAALLCCGCGARADLV